MIRKINLFLLLTVSILSLTVSLSNAFIKPATASDITSWLLCEAPWGDAKGLTQEIQQYRTTEKFNYILNGKSALAKSESGNIYNSILSIAGYKFGKENTNKTNSPFDIFGFSGLNYSSYIGEWKYYNIDGCKTLKSQTNSGDYGEYYKDRLDPLTTYSERNASKDIRTKQLQKNKYLLSFNNIMTNIILSINKFIVVIGIALVGLSFSDVSSLIGIGGEFAISMFKNLYNNFFIPLTTLMILLTGMYILYNGIIKKQYRESLINGIGKPILILFLTTVLFYKPEYLRVPNQITTFGQTLVLQTLGKSITSTSANDLCVSSKGLDDLEINNILEKSSENLKSIIGCRIWSEFAFKPWTKAQWNTTYDKLNKLNNINSKWVLEPEVKLGKDNKITNWAIFQISIQSGYHTPVDGVWTGHVNGIDKDWYRIVDALSNYDEIVVGYGNSSNSSSDNSSSSTSGGGGSWLTQGTASYNLAKQVYDYLVNEHGFSGKAAVGMLANIEAESGWDINAIEKNPTTSGGAGFGLFQFTDYVPGAGMRTSYLNWLKTRNRQNDWKSQVDFMLEAEIWNNNINNYLSNGYATNGITGTIKNAQEFVSSNDAVEATKAFMVGAERPNPIYSHLNSRRIPNAKKADQVFNSSNPSANKSKWKFSGGNTNNTTTTRLVDSSSNSGDYKVVQQVESKPLIYWDYWTGNIQGNRYTETLSSILFSIFGVGTIIILASISAALSIGIDLLMMISPMFLLFGLWGGKGNRIFMDYLGLLLSTMMKKIVLSFILLFYIILLTNIMDLINQLGYFLSLVYIIIISVILVKKKDEILDLLGRINIGSMNIDSFKKGINFAKNATKMTAKLSLTSAVGGLEAVRMGGNTKEILESTKAGGVKFILNQLATTELGRKAISVHNANRKDKPNSQVCIVCLNPIEEGRYAYMDGDYNVLHAECAQYHYPEEYTNWYGFTVDNSFENEEFKLSKKAITKEYPNGVSHPEYKDMYKLGIGRDNVKLDNERIAEIIRKSISKAEYDQELMLNYLSEKQKRNQTARFGELLVPDFLETYIDHEKLKEIQTSNNLENVSEFKKLVTDGWERYYNINIKNDDDIDFKDFIKDKNIEEEKE